ncbi:TetR family transcriptional regulator [Dactylosporangium sp. NPDC005572]|uniref:TetR/AcrR family transcriptional regulator n=1 Tax=Dactylosporangium sp. NPDC005572 TaxID=3156889 RepID=UPI0033A5E378
MDPTKTNERSKTPKEAIRQAATELFAASGYAATGVRAIAAQAGVDPALVIRHFGSKEALFLETMRLEGPFLQIVTGPLDGMGERIVRYVLESGSESMGPIFVHLLRASDSEVVRAHVRNAVEDLYVEPVSRRLEGDEASLRARLVAAQIAGLITTLWVVPDPELTAANPGRLARIYGAAIQNIIDGR